LQHRSYRGGRGRTFGTWTDAFNVQEDEFIRAEIAEELDRLNESWSEDGSRNIHKWFFILTPMNMNHMREFWDMNSRFMLKAII
jgi:hypothetical protein